MTGGIILLFKVIIQILNITEYITDVHLNDLSTPQILPSNEGVNPRLSASPPKSGNLWPGLPPTHKKGRSFSYSGFFALIV